jgi:hypothetical protein
VIVPPKVNYVTNRELLAEIHRSKATFSSFTDPDYQRCDYIAHNMDEAKTLLLNKRPTPKGSKVVPDGAPVVRLMTVEHIPFDPNKKKRGKDQGDQARTNFPAFTHLTLIDGEVVEVGRSHWKGSFTDGHFCLDHGRITNRLATMFMTMVDRYSRRGNWRGYCVDTETEALTQRGWLRWDEITTDDIILSYNGERLAWSRIKSIFRDQFTGKMHRLTVRGMDALVTPGHKFVTHEGLKPVELLLAKDRLILTGDAVAGPEASVRDEFVELVGWFVTEGNLHKDPARKYPRLTIYQNEGVNANRIRNCLTALGYGFDETHKKNKNSITIRFNLQKEGCLAVAAAIEPEDKVVRMDFILALSEHQREILIDAMISGDGHYSAHTGYTQRSEKHMDAFVALCAMAGRRTSTKTRDITSFGKSRTIQTATLFTSRSNVTGVENVDFHGGKRRGSGLNKLHHQNEPTEDYEGMVWCPETEFGCFMVRRNGKTYLTGNTYVDEMRAHALLQLSQIGLQFDESKSDNPFAFYTTAIRNCFTRVLNVEKKNQHIRDDLLIMAGAKPSMTRQINNELEQRLAERTK